MSDNETDGEEKKGKGKKKLFIIVGAALVVVLAAVGVVGFMFLGKSDEADKAEAAPEAGVVVPLEDEMTLNLADGRFLKIQLALQLTAEATEAAGAKPADTVDGSMAQDAAIAILSNYKYDQLLDPKVKEEARVKLTEEVKKRYDDAVMQVYFRQFVMQ